MRWDVAVAVPGADRIGRERTVPGGRREPSRGRQRVNQIERFPESQWKELRTANIVERVSDDGIVLLKAADRRLALIAALASCLHDTRKSGKVRHGLDVLLGQHVYGLACGYEDANDAAHLAGDPIHRLLVGRDAITGEALASQPTLSRLEIGVTRSELLRMSGALFETVLRQQVRRLRGKVRTITLEYLCTAEPCAEGHSDGLVGSASRRIVHHEAERPARASSQAPRTPRSGSSGPDRLAFMSRPG